MPGHAPLTEETQGKYAKTQWMQTIRNVGGVLGQRVAQRNNAIMRVK